MENLHNYLTSQHGKLRVGVIRTCLELKCEPWLGKADWKKVSKYLGLTKSTVRCRYQDFNAKLEEIGCNIYDVLELLKEDSSLENLSTNRLAKTRAVESEWTMPNGDLGTAERITYAQELPDDITPDYLISQAGLDIEDYLVDRVTVSNWGENQKAVKATFSRRTVPHEVTVESIREALSSIVPLQRKKKPKNLKVEVPLTGVLSLYDLHIGKVGLDQWGYNPEFLDFVLHEVSESLRDLNPTRLVIPLGNDLMHIDTPAGTTTLGTNQTSIGYSKLVKVVTQFSARLIDICEANCEMAYVLPVPGNHDHMAIHWVAEAMKQRYRNMGNVVVTDAKSFSFYDESNLSIMFTHKKRSDLPMVFAQRNPKGFAKLNKEIHIGHTHVENVKVVGGVTVRTLPALTGQDDWHEDSGYGSVQAGSIVKFKAGKCKGIDYITL